MEEKIYDWGCESCRTRPIWRAKDTLKLVNSWGDSCEVCDRRLGNEGEQRPGWLMRWWLLTGEDLAFGAAVILTLLGAFGLIVFGIWKFAEYLDRPTPPAIVRHEEIKEELTPDGQIPHVHPGDRMTSGQFNQMADKVNGLVNRKVTCKEVKSPYPGIACTDN